MSSASTSACPRCQRLNASHKVTCLYCGSKMPNPTAPPEESAPSQELDLLIRDAFKSGSIGKLKAALTQPDSGASTDAPAPSRSPAPPPSTGASLVREPAPPPRAPAREPGPPASLASDSSPEARALGQLKTLVADAERCYLAGDHDRYREHLRSVSRLAERALNRLS